MSALVELWPYLLAAAAVLFWLALLRRRIERKWLYLAVAFVLCAVSNLAIEFASGFVIPLDVAGTPPPDPRNASLRFLITAAVQAPVALGLSCYLALLGFRPR